MSQIVSSKLLKNFVKILFSFVEKKNDKTRQLRGFAEFSGKTRSASQRTSLISLNFNEKIDLR